MLSQRRDQRQGVRMRFRGCGLHHGGALRYRSGRSSKSGGRSTRGRSGRAWICSPGPTRRRCSPGRKSIIVLIEPYFREAFPPSLERHFGRCYLDDDRMIGNRLGKRVKAFRAFLRDNGIDSKVPFHLPHRLAAARAGLGTFGKNCLFYSRKVAAGGSWVTPIAVVVDQAFAPDEPTLEVGCPDWCRNACIAACPTGAP